MTHARTQVGRVHFQRIVGAAGPVSRRRLHGPVAAHCGRGGEANSCEFGFRDLPQGQRLHSGAAGHAQSRLSAPVSGGGSAGDNILLCYLIFGLL